MPRLMTILILGCSTLAASGEDWPQWRGPSRDCQVKQQSWPNTLAEPSLKLSWRIPLGPSYSGPIVMGDRVFVTETRDRTHEVVRALDRRTGAELWKNEWLGAMTVPFFASANGSWIRSTPACDGEHLFVVGMRDVLVCLELETGTESWRIDFVESFGSSLPSFGAICSPIIDGEFLFLQAGASVVKLNKSDGSVVWRSSPDDGGIYGEGMGASAFSSPVIADLAGKRHLIVQSREALSGYDLDSGDQLWSVNIPAFRGMNILTPTVFNNSIFTSSYGGGSFLFDAKSEENKLVVSERWSNKKEGYMSSPALISGSLYMHLKNQRFSCIDPETGDTKWTTSPQGKYWSMVVNGDQILALDERGELILIDASPSEFKEVSRRSISDSTTWAHLAISNDQLFIRELDGIAAWDWK